MSPMWLPPLRGHERVLEPRLPRPRQSAHSLLEFLEPLDVGGLGLLRLLLEDLMALGHPPVIRLR